MKKLNITIIILVLIAFSIFMWIRYRDNRVEDEVETVEELTWQERCEKQGFEKTFIPDEIQKDLNRVLDNENATTTLSGELNYIKYDYSKPKISCEELFLMEYERKWNWEEVMCEYNKREHIFGLLIGKIEKRMITNHCICNVYSELLDEKENEYATYESDDRDPIFSKTFQLKNTAFSSETCEGIRKRGLE